MGGMVRPAVETALGAVSGLPQALAPPHTAPAGALRTR
jgi:hypothetical protein